MCMLPNEAMGGLKFEGYSNIPLNPDIDDQRTLSLESDSGTGATAYNVRPSAAQALEAADRVARLRCLVEGPPAVQARTATLLSRSASHSAAHLGVC